MEPIYLNHFFLTVDSQTYSDIKASDFLKEEFATFEQRTTVRADATYTGVYFYGTRTYFEFFEAAKASGRPEGATGIASGIEVRGGSDLLKRRLDGVAGISAAKSLITRKTEIGEVPWFYSVGGTFRDLTRILSTWTMEYHENFLDNWHSQLPPSTRGITREEILDRYVAKAGGDRGRKILDDVIEIELALDGDDSTRFVKEREAFGYRLSGGAEQTVCEGPEVKYIVRSREPDALGITSVTMSLRRDKPGRETYRFGPRSVLRFNEDRTATWSF